MQTPLADTWQRLSFDTMQSQDALAILPILSDLPMGPEYLTLGEALTTGTLVITEINEGGSVPELAVSNQGTLPVLLLDGEELAGAKQNRVLNTTILLKEFSKTVIPVSCVEEGRWHYASDEFQESGNVMAASLRVRKSQAVSQNMASHGKRYSNQSDVWEGVEEMACCFNVNSDTGAMRDVYEHVEHDLAGLLCAFKPVPFQRGIAAFINGHIAGVEYLSNPRAFAQVFEKLLGSYAMNTLSLQKPGKATADPDEARKFIATIASSTVKAYNALGYGHEHRIDGNNSHGSALMVDDALIHLSLLATAPVDDEEVMEVPFPRSYWVQPGQLLAGCYPGAPKKHEATQKLNSMLDTGIRVIVNLMEPEETDHHGNPFKQYESLFEKLAAERHVNVAFIRKSIPDMCIPTREAMREILDTIDELIESGMPVFVHCWGGKGRTGTVVGCWLARHGLANGREVLQRVQYLRRNDPTADDPSPQNEMQCNMVRSWRVGE